MDDGSVGRVPSDVSIINELSARIRRLLAAVGDRSTCTGCNADIYWVRHGNGKRAPYTPEGLNHFADCPKANTFRR